MEHFVVKDVFDHIGRNRRAVQHGMNPYDPFVRAVAAEAYASGPTASFPRSPGDGATEPAAEMVLVELLKITSQIDMLSLRTKARASRFYRNPGRPDHPFVILDEGPQEVFLPEGRASNERGKGSQHIFCLVKKHLMKPNRAGAVFPPHRDYGSRVVREGERHGDGEEFPEP
jgi:hypothetical protein